jgi:hypothetical protein
LKNSERDSVDVWLKVRKEDVYLICPYFEAFAGMVAVRTPRPAAGEYASLKLMVSPDFLADFEKVLASLAKHLTLLIPLSIKDGEGETRSAAEGGGEV